MAAFDKICSGYPQMDDILDSIRLGDNVVWQISDLDEFRFFAEPFVRQAVMDGRNVIYIRFAQHDPVIQDLTGVTVKNFNPDLGFESFTVSIHDEITRQGKDAFYVFDSLSELQSIWYTDLMMGNFFRVTCPYLFELDTVAYFPLLRGRHSFDALARIRDTTQLLLDVYSNESNIYLHPLKVWNRYSSKMFLPYFYSKTNHHFSLVDDGVSMSRYYFTRQQITASSSDQNYDSYERFFAEAKRDYKLGVFSEKTKDLIIDSTITKDKRLKKLVKKYYAPEDFFHLKSRIIGSGAIGGKACGMLLARKIADTEIPEFSAYSEPHDSFYIGSDIYYTYIVENNSWKLRIRQKTKQEYFSAATELKEELLKGQFPSNIQKQFLQVIEYFGQSPFIVRSSSFLEDGFGNAFAGKYESVFCVNQGSPEERLKEFEQAVRIVYASSMDYSALEYRALRGLENKDEQMAILVQRVSGSHYGNYFLPCAAGVGYSHSAYKWYPDMNPNAGMLRIVMGLGTKAVDRTKEDYPRLSNLDKPTVTVMTTLEQKHKFSQRNVDVLDCSSNQFLEVPMETLLPLMPMWYKKMVLEHDYDAEYHLRQLGRHTDVLFISCQKLLENKIFTDLMQKILKTLSTVYENAVDIEYTVNMNKDGDFVINLLQCRPLYLGKNGKSIPIDSIHPKKTLFEIKDSSMGSSDKRRIDIIVSIDPVLYYNYPYRLKYNVASAIGQINQYYRNQNKNILLLTPGRVGTSSPELGVPVTFGDISAFSVLCEVSDKRAGYMPELSYGSHMFQDLVEAEIAYGAIWNNQKTMQYHPEFLEDFPDLYETICPSYPEFRQMVTVREVRSCYYWLDSISNHAICGFLDTEK